MNNKVTVTGVNKLFFIFSILFLFVQLVLSVFDSLFGLGLFEWNIYIVLLINEFILILLPVLIYSFAKKLNFKEVFRFNNPGLLPLIIIALISVPAYFTASMLNNIVVYFIQFIGEVPIQEIPVPQSLLEFGMGILIVAVTPAICEEMLHRGLLLKGYEIRGSIRAVFITAIFFGIFHMDLTNLVGPIFLGILIGYYVIRTNSIFAGMLAHFMNNTIAESISYYYRTSELLNTQFISLSDLGSIILFGISGLAAVIALLKWFNLVTLNKSIIRFPISSKRNDALSILSHWPVICTLSLYMFVAVFQILILAAHRFI